MGHAGEILNRFRPERPPRICFRQRLENRCEQDKICSANPLGIRNPMACNCNQETGSRKYFRQNRPVAQVNPVRSARSCHVGAVIHEDFRLMRIR